MHFNCINTRQRSKLKTLHGCPWPRLEDTKAVEVWLHSFLTSALGGVKWSASRQGRFIPGKERRYPLSRRVSGPHRGYGRYWRRENSFSPVVITSNEYMLLQIMQKAAQKQSRSSDPPICQVCGIYKTFRRNSTADCTTPWPLAATSVGGWAWGDGEGEGEVRYKVSHILHSCRKEL